MPESPEPRSRTWKEGIASEGLGRLGGDWERGETHLDLLLQLKLRLYAFMGWVSGDESGDEEVTGTDLLEALFGLPVQPLILLADLDSTRRHAGTHGWKVCRGRRKRTGMWERRRHGREEDERARERACEAEEGVKKQELSRRIRWMGDDGNRGRAEMSGAGAGCGRRRRALTGKERRPGGRSGTGAGVDEEGGGREI